MSAVMQIESTNRFDVNPGKSGLDAATRPVASDTSARSIPALVIGDIHGHVDRLEALLRQEGILDWCPTCHGFGTEGDTWEEERDCRHCKGNGVKRTDKPAEVILLGDLGHFGKDGSPTGDVLTWDFAIEWADVILWGNHDRAMVDPRHEFTGFHRYPQDAFDRFAEARRLGKLKLAHAAHGWLCTHAGLHLAFRNQAGVPESVKEDPEEFARWINAVEDPSFDGGTGEQIAVRDAISRKRQGSSPFGGILWRDIREKLFTDFPQVFGHSSDHKEHAVRFCGSGDCTRDKEIAVASKLSDKLSYCVDVGGRSAKRGGKGNCLAGIWLPDERIVRVDL